MFGTNPIRKQDLSGRATQRLWIQEIFYTIQGEGPAAGTPAVFVRTGGCNLACHFCDTDFESNKWNPTTDEILAAINTAATGHEEIIKESPTTASARDCKERLTSLVVITGGEPLRQEITRLIRCLFEAGFTVQIETNGTLMLDDLKSLKHFIGQRLIIVCSPKTPKLNPLLDPLIDAYKYIVSVNTTNDNGLPGASTQRLNVMQTIAPPRSGFPAEKVFLQPCEEYTSEGKPDWERTKANIAHAAKLCMKHGYRLSVQTHKLAGIP